MVGVVLLLLLIIPIVELFVVIQVGHWIGALPTLALLMAFTIGGAWLVKRAGVGAWSRFRSQVQTGVLPTNELLDGLLILVAGLLIIFPGFVTDVIGLLLLIPPSRSLARWALARRYRVRLQAASVGYTRAGEAFGYTQVYDVENVGDVTPADWRRDSGAPRGELGP
jgi:UPF0716 protein FxsA